jgi:hypothetical protein
LGPHPHGNPYSPLIAGAIRSRLKRRTGWAGPLAPALYSFSFDFRFYWAFPRFFRFLVCFFLVFAGFVDFEICSDLFFVQI